MLVNENKRITGRSGKRGTFLLVFLLIAGMIFSPALSKIVKAVDETGSLIVHPGFVDDGEDEQYPNDIEKANVVYDLYKVADMVKDSKYDTYNFENGLSGIQPILERIQSLTEDSEESAVDLYKQAAQLAAKDVQSYTPVSPEDGQPVEEKLEGLEAGLYLLIARGQKFKRTDFDKYMDTNDEGDIITIANSTIFEYSFVPELIAIPNTHEVIEPNDTIKTSDGPWKWDITATLKPGRKKRLGNLRIIKDLKNFDAKKSVSYIFDVVATVEDEEEPVFQNIYTINFTAADVAGRKYVDIVQKIPVDAKVTVTEKYSGMNYEGVVPEGTATILAPASVEEWAVGDAYVTLENDYVPTDKGGGSVLNMFNAVEGKDSEGNTYHWELKTVKNEDDSEIPGKDVIPEEE